MVCNYELSNHYVEEESKEIKLICLRCINDGAYPRYSKRNKQIFKQFNLCHRFMTLTHEQDMLNQISDFVQGKKSES